MDRKELTNSYRELDRDIILFEGWDRKEGDELTLPADRKEEYQAFVARADALETPDPVFALLKSHFQDYLGAMKKQVERGEDNPARRLAWCTWGFSALLRTDRRALPERYSDFLLKAENQKKLWEAAKPRLKDTDAGELKRFCDSLTGTIQDLKWIAEEVPDWFSPLGEDKVRASQEALTDLAGEMGGWQAWIRDELLPSEDGGTDEAAAGTSGGTDGAAEAGASGGTDKAAAAGAKNAGEKKADGDIPDSERRVKLEEGEYARILHDELGVELSELLSWYEQEIEVTRAEVLASAADAIRQSGVGEKLPETVGEANDLLWKYAGPCDTPEEMFARARTYLKRTRALAHEFVNLPDDEQAVCIKVPSQLRVSYPWGGYEDADMNKSAVYRQKPIIGQMFLNQYNYKEITDGWIKMNSMHETYPGHHVQYVRSITDTLPHTLRKGAKHIPLIEGTAHRTERAFEWIFGEDPWFPLFVSYRRHHTSVRIKADLMLFYFGNTVEEVTQLYMDELGFAHHIARGQVQSQMNTPGYFTCYYYGMKKLCDWEKEFGYSKKDYTELLFSIGNMSMENVRRYLELSEEDKKRFRTEFNSLLL